MRGSARVGAKLVALEHLLLSAEVMAKGYRILQHLGAENEGQKVLRVVIDAIEWRQSAEDPKPHCRTSQIRSKSRSSRSLRLIQK